MDGGSLPSMSVTTIDAVPPPVGGPLSLLRMSKACCMMMGLLPRRNRTHLGGQGGRAAGRLIRGETNKQFNKAGISCSVTRGNITSLKSAVGQLTWRMHSRTPSPRKALGRALAHALTVGRLQRLPRRRAIQ